MKLKIQPTAILIRGASLLGMLAITAIEYADGADLSFTETGQQLNLFVGRGVTLADFNGDGALDAYVSNEEGCRVYLGDGHGRFADSGQKLAKPTRGGGDPAFFDLNGDGRPELIAGTTVWLIDAQGIFTAQPLQVESGETVELGRMAFADLNGDGHADLFAFRTYTASRVYLNDGHGRFRDTDQRLGDGTIGTGQLAQIALGDIDGNGTVDAVTAGWRWDGSTECPNHVWLNDGKGNFRDGNQPLDEGGSHVHGLTLADLNGDGRPDLVMAIQDRDRSGRVFLNDGHGRLVPGANIGGASGESAVLADFDGDGTTDIFMAQSTAPNHVWLNDGKGTFRDGGVRLGDSSCWDAAASDFNGDGKPDVFAAACIWGRNGLTPATAQIWLNDTAARGDAPVTRAGTGGLRIAYPGNRLPGATPDVFAPGLLAPEDSTTLDLSIARDGKTIYFQRTADGVATMNFIRYTASGWTEPESSTAFPGMPVFTAAGKACYQTDEGIFAKEPTANGGWSEGRLVARIANMGPGFSIADSGNLYVPITDPTYPVSGVFEVHVLRLVNGVYQTPERLPGSFYSGQPQQHVFVAPDESYILFDSGRGLNLSVRNPDGSWSPARGLGAPLNTRNDWSGCVSPDGLALFYYSRSDNQLHWLEWPPLLEKQQRQLLAPAATDATLALGGIALGNVTPHDLAMVTSSVPESVEVLRRAGRTIPEQVDTLLTAARAASSAGDRYRAYRLFARALGRAWGEDRVDYYEAAASINVSLNRAIFADGETITLALEPLFTLGHPLTQPCTAESWLETEQGVIAGTEQKLTVTVPTPHRFEFATDPLPEGVIGVGYRLRAPDGTRLAERKYAVVVAKNVTDRVARLQARLAALNPANASPVYRSAHETIEYYLQSLEIERTRFDGHWIRESHPFGMSGNLTNAALGEEVASGFPGFVGRMRFPDDLVFAEQLASKAAADPEFLRGGSGDFSLAIRSSADGRFLHYRLYVPGKAGVPQTRGLVVALHSGEGDAAYLDWPNFKDPNGKTLQHLANEQGFIIAVPNGERGFTGGRGEQDILDIIDRVQAAYGIEAKQTFIMGWSLGGAATWRFAMKYPGRVAAMASVTGSAEWINQRNTQTATALPVLQCEPEQDQLSDRAARTKSQATTLLPSFTFKTYPGTDHLTVWHKALPDVFAFFEACPGANKRGRVPRSAPLCRWYQRRCRAL